METFQKSVERSYNQLPQSVAALCNFNRPRTVLPSSESSSDTSITAASPTFYPLKKESCATTVDADVKENISPTADVLQSATSTSGSALQKSDGSMDVIGRTAPASGTGKEFRGIFVKLPPALTPKDNATRVAGTREVIKRTAEVEISLKPPDDSRAIPMGHMPPKSNKRIACSLCRQKKVCYSPFTRLDLADS